MIRIWKFRDAPAKYARLSEHGGDEDWVAVVPGIYRDEMLVGVFFTRDFANAPHPFGVCSIQETPMTDGTDEIVFIGAHA